VADPLRLPDDVALIPLPTPFEVGTVNAYLLKGEPVTLLDPGPQTDEAVQALLAGLTEHRTRLADIELVLLTHQHEDHVGMAHAVAQASGATIAGVPKLARLMHDYDASMDIEDRYIKATMLRHGVDAQTASALERTWREFRRFVRSAEITRVVDEGSRVTAGGRELSVLRAPGHSPTDTLFLSEADGVLLGGDHLLERISSNPVAHWPIDDREPEESSAASDRRRPLIEYIASVRRTSELDVSLVLPGHGAPFRGHRGIIERRIAMHEQRARTILDAINGPMSADELGRRLWHDVPGAEAYLVLSEVLGHLDLLEQGGQVRAVGNGGLVCWERATRARRARLQSAE
jgi:glyoxylase-like metal-dependent hydrolase (beta-lactamase superfamily II)